MIITNWLARAEGNRGFVFPDEFLNTKTRIYGNVYGHPDFKDGEYVQTAIVTGYDGVKITTASGEDFTLLKEAYMYLNYLAAIYNHLVILKEWRVADGCLVGKRLDGEAIAGRVVRQNFKENICKLEDGMLVFVDWLSKAAGYIPNRGYEEFLVFGIERCMPDIFGKHYSMFRKSSNEGCR